MGVEIFTCDQNDPVLALLVAFSLVTSGKFPFACSGFAGGLSGSASLASVRVISVTDGSSRDTCSATTSRFAASRGGGGGGRCPLLDSEGCSGF
ncbi:hypothetical protein DIPPA_18414 [Diplonema papillatum]|nr:hypothetical protein DIPPA_18414 [Diplonema papillatum]